MRISNDVLLAMNIRPTRALMCALVMSRECEMWYMRGGVWAKDALGWRLVLEVSEV